MILDAIYRSLNMKQCDMKQYETHFKKIFSKNGKNLKNIILAGDFNIRFLDFEKLKTFKAF